MALVNLFNAMNMRPHIPYRFKAEIWPYIKDYSKDSEYQLYEFTIKSIKQPTFTLNGDNKKHFGNTAYVVPVFKFGETSMDITFEETDNMDVYNFLANFMGSELYKKVSSALMNIRITQYNESMATVIDRKTYVCRLKEYSMPSFNNNGFGSPVELTASFNVLYIMHEPELIEGYVERNGTATIDREELPDNVNVVNQFKQIQEEEKTSESRMNNVTKKQKEAYENVANSAMLTMGYDPNNADSVKEFRDMLHDNNINIDNGLSNNELKRLVDVVKENADPRAEADIIKSLAESINEAEQLNNEQDALRQKLLDERWNSLRSSSRDYSVRPSSPKTEEIQANEKTAASAAKVSYLAMAMANGGEGEIKGKGYELRKEITDSEMQKAKRLQETLDNTKGGKELQQFVDELSNKQYGYGKKGRDGEIETKSALDCSGAAGAWAERMGYDINENTASAKTGSLVKQLVSQGATDVGKNYDTGLKPGDILNKTSTKSGNTGHVVIFLGYDGDRNMIIAESSGRTGEGGNISAGGRVRTVSIQGMKDAGYTGVKIMDNAKPRNVPNNP